MAIVHCVTSDQFPFLELQSVSARWRSLAGKYLRQATDRRTPPDFSNSCFRRIKHLVNACSTYSVVDAKAWEPVITKLAEFWSQFVFPFIKVAREGLLASDYELIRIEDGSKCSEDMKVDGELGTSNLGGIVICTRMLGLKAITSSVVTGGTKAEPEEKILVKPVVVLRSILREELAARTKAAPPVAESPRKPSSSTIPPFSFYSRSNLQLCRSQEIRNKFHQPQPHQTEITILLLASRQCQRIAIHLPTPKLLRARCKNVLLTERTIRRLLVPRHWTWKCLTWTLPLWRLVSREVKHKHKYIVEASKGPVLVVESLRSFFCASCNENK